jgi:hypothetical protein
MGRSPRATTLARYDPHHQPLSRKAGEGLVVEA